MIVHHCITRSNTTVNWYGTDTEEHYQKNLQDPEKRKLLEKYQWIDCRPIEYSYNSQGFRDREIDDRACGVALGCSFTEGTGLYQEQTWPYLLGQALKTHVWNFGVAGGSADTSFRICEWAIKEVRPKFVAFLHPPIHRLEYFINHGKTSMVLMPMCLSENSEFIKNWFSNDINSWTNSKKNILAMQALCNDAGIPFIHSSWNHCNERSNDSPYRRFTARTARDLMHPGPEFHQKLTEIFVSQLSLTF